MVHGTQHLDVYFSLNNLMTTDQLTLSLFEHLLHNNPFQIKILTLYQLSIIYQPMVLELVEHIIEDVLTMSEATV